jgi:hypothetical protein
VAADVLPDQPGELGAQARPPTEAPIRRHQLGATARRSGADDLCSPSGPFRVHMVREIGRPVAVCAVPDRTSGLLYAGAGGRSDGRATHHPQTPDTWDEEPTPIARGERPLARPITDTERRGARSQICIRRWALQEAGEGGEGVRHRGSRRAAGRGSRQRRASRPTGA